MGGCVASWHSGHLIVLLPPRPEGAAEAQHQASDHEIDGDLFTRPALTRPHQPPPPLLPLSAPGWQGRSPQDGFDALHQIFGHHPAHYTLAEK